MDRAERTIMRAFGWLIATTATLVAVWICVAVLGSANHSSAQTATPPASVSVPVITSEVLGAATPAEVHNPELALSRVTIMPGAAIPVHYHPGTQIGAVVQGELTYTVFTGSVQLFRAAAKSREPEIVRSGQT